MNCIIIDDERPALDLLEDNLKQIPYLTVVATCRNPLLLPSLLEEHQVDLLFLDINMPSLNGLELLKSLKNAPLTILVTAYQEYALDSFELDVVDYLLKPVPFNRLLKATNKALERHQNKQQTQQQEPYVFVNANYSLVRVNLNEIAFVEGLKDYVRIHILGAKPIITRMGMKVLEEKLESSQFIRVHKSYIVALNKIDAIQKTQLIIDGQEIPIGLGYRELLLQHIANKNL